MTVRRAVHFVMVSGVSMMMLASATRAQPAERSDDPVIVVTGRASMSVPADEVRLSISVVSEGGEPSKVIEENSQRVARVLDALQRAGIGDDEVSSGWFSIQPMYSQPKMGERNFKPRIVGYRVRNSVIVKTQQLRLAGELVQAAVDSGANRVDSVIFGLADERARRSDVLAQAVANAKSDAEAVATAAGARLGAIANIAIDSPAPIIPMRQVSVSMAMDRVGGGVSAPPFIPGQIEVRASVTIEYVIEQ